MLLLLLIILKCFCFAVVGPSKNLPSWCHSTLHLCLPCSSSVIGQCNTIQGWQKVWTWRRRSYHTICSTFGHFLRVGHSANCVTRRFAVSRNAICDPLCPGWIQAEWNTGRLWVWRRCSPDSWTVVSCFKTRCLDSLPTGRLSHTGTCNWLFLYCL